MGVSCVDGIRPRYRINTGMAQSKLTIIGQEKTSAELRTMSRQALQWIQQKIDAIRNPSSVPNSIKKETYREVKKFKLGQLYFFYYDPKGKADLPYYDRFPLVITLNTYDDGFLGLNLHYLPYKYRVAFLGKLMKYAILDDAGDIQRLKVTYDILVASRRLKEFEPCLKRYLFSHVQSKILSVQPNEWDVAASLPIQQFRKAKAIEVWEDSVQQTRKK